MSDLISPFPPFPRNIPNKLLSLSLFWTGRISAINKATLEVVNNVWTACAEGFPKGRNYFVVAVYHGAVRCHAWKADGVALEQAVSCAEFLQVSGSWVVTPEKTGLWNSKVNHTDEKRERGRRKGENWSHQILTGAKKFHAKAETAALSHDLVGKKRQEHMSMTDCQL